MMGLGWPFFVSLPEGGQCPLTCLPLWPEVQRLCAWSPASYPPVLYKAPTNQYCRKARKNRENKKKNGLNRALSNMN
ncbi:hypothetical protein HY994_05395 [Candidatus Micrarchaeota archaeon]|nr:hypothetical protein [Candidatus Micrarchaeota archaeon]